MKATNPTSQSKTLKRGSISSKACQRCRLKKIKCDSVSELKNCSRCLKDSVNCVYSTEKRKRGPAVKNPIISNTKTNVVSVDDLNSLNKGTSIKQEEGNKKSFNTNLNGQPTHFNLPSFSSLFSTSDPQSAKSDPSAKDDILFNDTNSLLNNNNQSPRQTNLQLDRTKLHSIQEYYYSNASEVSNGKENDGSNYSYLSVFKESSPVSSTTSLPPSPTPIPKHISNTHYVFNLKTKITNFTDCIDESKPNIVSKVSTTTFRKACQNCRIKKRKCDGKIGVSCSRCLNESNECIYFQSTRKR
ncbi:hypothetical protein HK099_007228, partial [Clydaea vesicula]